MSDYGSVEEIKRKIAGGIYQEFAKGGNASARSNVWNFFEGINAATGDDAEKRTELPFVSCKRCKKVLSYDKIKGVRQDMLTTYCSYIQIRFRCTHTEISCCSL
jgi:hypothetical protein